MILKKVNLELLVMKIISELKKLNKITSLNNLKI